MPINLLSFMRSHYDHHIFYRDCLKGHIESSENPEVRCPFMDDNYKCDEVMQEREIREVGSSDLYLNTGSISLHL